MMTDTEYAAALKIDVAELENIGPDAQMFTCFEWDLARAVDNSGNPLYPEIVERNNAGMIKRVPAWRVAKHSKHSLRAVIEAEKAEEEKKRQANLARYIEQGFAFDENALTNPKGYDETDCEED